MTIWAIVPAAGVGRRMGPSDPANSASQATPKQYRSLNGRAVLSHSLGKLLSIADIQAIVVLLRPDDHYWQELPESTASRIQTAEGGAERELTVLNGLRQLPAKAGDWVLVHDAVRPCVSGQDLRNLISTLSDHPVGGLLAAPVDNTLKRVADSHEVRETVDRAGIWNALTPQMFRYELLLSALEAAVESSHSVTDEASAMEQAGYSPAIVEGSKQNIKITHEGDLALASLILSAEEKAND